MNLKTCSFLVSTSTSQQGSMTFKNHPENVHTCKVCRKKSKRLYNLRLHMRNIHHDSTEDVCMYCSPSLDDIDDDSNTENSDSEDKNSDSGNEQEDEIEYDSEGEDSDSGDEQEDTEVEENGQETSIWKRFKKKALKDNFDDKNIVKDVIQIYLTHVEFKLLMDKDKLHKNYLRR